MRKTVPPSSLATHIASRPAAIAVGLAPRSTVGDTAALAMSTFVSAAVDLGGDPHRASGHADRGGAVPEGDAAHDSVGLAG